MKRPYSIIVAITILLWCACGPRTETKDEHLADSIIADTPVLDSANIGGVATDSPALGTDNIRMDSMNNSSR